MRSSDVKPTASYSPYHIIPCQTRPYHPTPLHVPYHTIPNHIMLDLTIPYHTKPHHAPYHTIPYHIMLDLTVPHNPHYTIYHIMSCQTTPYHTISWQSCPISCSKWTRGQWSNAKKTLDNRVHHNSPPTSCRIKTQPSLPILTHSALRPDHLSSRLRVQAGTGSYPGVSSGSPAGEHSETPACDPDFFFVPVQQRD